MENGKHRATTNKNNKKCNNETNVNQTHPSPTKQHTTVAAALQRLQQLVDQTQNRQQ